EQVYWLPANEIASQASTPAKPVTPYVPKSPPPSQVLATLHNIKAVFPQFDAIIKERTTVKPLYVSLPCYEYAKEFALQQVVPFLDYFKKHVQTADDTIVKEVEDLLEHSKVVELEAEILKKQQMLHESKKRCAFIEKNHVKLQDQLQGKDETIRNLQTQINITRMLNVGSTVGSFNKQALETELTQLKDVLTSVRIQIDGYKAKNVNLKRRYEELSKSNAYSRFTFTVKINALTAENAKLKTELSGKKSSGSIASEKPKVLASGMYTNSSKYVPPPKRANWVKPTPLPKKKQGTFQEPPRTSNRPTQKPPMQQNKKSNVLVNLKSVNARRAADHNRKLNVVDHNQFVIRSLKSVNTKTPQAKHSVNHTKKVWKAKVVASVKPQWKPTGRHFILYDKYPLTRIVEPIVEPLELTPCVSSSSKVTMISRVTDYILSDQKAGSKGISGSTNCLLRTSSIRESGTLVLEDIKALSWKTCQEGSLLNLSDHSKYEHVGPKFSEWRIEEKIISNSRKSEIKMKLSNLVIQVSKIEFLQKHKLILDAKGMRVVPPRSADSNCLITLSISINGIWFREQQAIRKSNTSVQYSLLIGIGLPVYKNEQRVDYSRANG
ncbi:hypothetical protein Tco_1505794, partial [Tanacetum coccineum]